MPVGPHCQDPPAFPGAILHLRARARERRLRLRLLSQLPPTD